MNNEIEKSEQANLDDVLVAIQSFNDPSIITNIFRELGWSYSLEIKETLAMAKQNANLSIKFKAIKHLRELLREAAETSGLIANVSQTFPNAQGGHTTFHAKRITGILNPTKQIESTIKEPENECTRETQTEKSQAEHQTEPDRRCDRGQSQDDERYPTNSGQSRISDLGTDTRRAFPTGDVESGGTKSPDEGEAPRPVPGESGGSDSHSPKSPDNPCIQTRPPTCDQDLFPGVSSAGE